MTAGTGPPIYTRIRFLLSGLARYGEITVDSISFGLLPRESIPARLYNNASRPPPFVPRITSLATGPLLFCQPALVDDVPEPAPLPALCGRQRALRGAAGDGGVLLFQGDTPNRIEPGYVGADTGDLSS